MRSLELVFYFVISIVYLQLVQCIVSSPDLEIPWERYLPNKHVKEISDSSKNYKNVQFEGKRRTSRQTYPGSSNPYYSHAQPHYNGVSNTPTTVRNNVYPNLPTQYPTYQHTYPTNQPISPRPSYQTLPGNNPFLYNSNYSSGSNSVSHNNPYHKNQQIFNPGYNINTKLPNYGTSYPNTYPNQQPQNYGSYPQFKAPNMTNPSLYNHGYRTTTPNYTNTRPQTYPGYGVNHSFGSNQSYPIQNSNLNGYNNPYTTNNSSTFGGGSKYPNYNPIGNLILNGPPAQANRTRVQNGNAPGYQNTHGTYPTNNNYNPAPASTQFGQGLTNNNYNPAPANTQFGPGLTNNNYNPVPANAQFGQGHTNNNYNPVPANAQFGQGHTNNNYNPAPANAQFGQGHTNNNYNPVPTNTQFGQGYTNQYPNYGQNYNPTVPYPGSEPNHFFHNPPNNTPTDPRKVGPHRYSY